MMLLDNPMIHSFSDKTAMAVFNGQSARQLPATLYKRANLKLWAVHHAHSLEDLRIPPSNHLEALKGDRIGYYSIRINDQWRICFRWQEGHAYDVEIVDYH